MPVVRVEPTTCTRRTCADPKKVCSMSALCGCTIWVHYMGAHMRNLFDTGPDINVMPLCRINSGRCLSRRDVENGVERGDSQRLIDEVIIRF